MLILVVLFKAMLTEINQLFGAYIALGVGNYVAVRISDY